MPKPTYIMIWYNTTYMTFILSHLRALLWHATTKVGSVPSTVVTSNMIIMLNDMISNIIPNNLRWYRETKEHSYYFTRNENASALLVFPTRPYTSPAFCPVCAKGRVSDITDLLAIRCSCDCRFEAARACAFVWRSKHRSGFAFSFVFVCLLFMLFF